MLKSLEVQNLALIDKLNIEFSPSLNVLSGETGAGKSIIIDALNFAIGAKPSKNLIKHGREFMKVQALFYGPFSDKVEEVLKEYDVEDASELLISRKYWADGRGDIRLNGSTITVNMLKNLTSLLVDIHGQHEHQYLLKDKYHLEIIDLFLKDKSNLEKYQDGLAKLKVVKSQIEKLDGSTQNQERMLDLIAYQINEIERANLRIGEDDELIQKRTLMLNAEKIYESLSNSLDEIETKGQVLDLLKKSKVSLASIAKFDESLDSTLQRLDNVRYELMDVVEILKDKRENANFDQKEFDEIDQRLDLIKLLKKKYGSTIEDVLQFLQKSKEEYDNIVNSKDKLLLALKQKDEILKDLLVFSAKLSEQRREVAKIFEKNVKKQLDDLGMKNASFSVEFSYVPQIDSLEKHLLPMGVDEVRFLFSANLGQNLRPLSEIISGGEASRFMLALKNILAEHDNISTMIFDEIDTGISGDMGYKVACKLANISKSHQVMSVSHLPQICAMADNNLKVEKQVLNEDTFVTVSKLDNDGVLEEISRLSGGTVGSNVSVQHAKELKDRCNNYKKGL